MHPEHIKAELRIRGSSLACISRDLGYGYSAVVNCVKGGRSKRVETRIAQVLGVPVWEVFPDRYPAEAQAARAQ